MKEHFIRYLIEEIIRRSFKNDQAAPGQNQIIEILIDDHEKFFNRVWGRRKADIESSNKSNSTGGGYSGYDYEVK